MKRTLAFLLTILLCLPFYGCEEAEDNIIDPIEMKNICELATVECYFHNVAKFTDEDRKTFLWMEKDAHFWIEYTAIVKYGIDTSELKIEVDNDTVTIRMPDAKLLSTGDVILTKDSYILDKNSAKITVKDEITAISEAQSNMEQRAANNTMLLNMAKEDAKVLLANYITNLGEALGKNYTIVWIDSNNNTAGNEITPADTSVN